MIFKPITNLFKVEISVSRNKIYDIKNPLGLHAAEKFSLIIEILLALYTSL